MPSLTSKKQTFTLAESFISAAKSTERSTMNGLGVSFKMYPSLWKHAKHITALPKSYTSTNSPLKVNYSLAPADRNTADF